eukprot:1403430-Lingulodinium_polyedra.AAC.1
MLLVALSGRPKVARPPPSVARTLAPASLQDCSRQSRALVPALSWTRPPRQVAARMTKRERPRHARCRALRW